jgi:phosphinothricin acetyltransferase
MLSQIRLATLSDLNAINQIYNHYVDTSTCTYAESPTTETERRVWFDSHDATHPITVAEIDGKIVGWGSLSAFHDRSAYRFTVENSVYVSAKHHHQGIGSAILRDLIDRACAAGHHTIIAGIDAEQKPSISLHSRFGFKPVAHLRQVGFKFGRWLDVVYMQLLL